MNHSKDSGEWKKHYFRASDYDPEFICGLCGSLKTSPIHNIAPTHSKNWADKGIDQLYKDIVECQKEDGRPHRVRNIIRDFIYPIIASARADEAEKWEDKYEHSLAMQKNIAEDSRKVGRTEGFKLGRDEVFQADMNQKSYERGEVYGEKKGRTETLSKLKGQIADRREGEAESEYEKGYNAALDDLLSKIEKETT